MNATLLTAVLATLGACATSRPVDIGAVDQAPRPRSTRDSERDSAAAQAYANAHGPRVEAKADIDEMGNQRRVRASFTLQDDAYVFVGHVDSRGQMHVLFPTSPRDDGFVEGGRTYRLPEFKAGWESEYAYSRAAGDLRWRSTASRHDSYDGGTGYVFVVASWRPMELDRIAEDSTWSTYELVDMRSTVDPRRAIDELADLLAGDAHEAYSVEYAPYYRTTISSAYGLATLSSDAVYGGGYGYSSARGCSRYGSGGAFSPWWGGFGGFRYGALGYIPAGAGWFYVPISDPFSGCTSYQLAYFGYGQPQRIWPYSPGRPRMPVDTTHRDSAQAQGIAYRARPIDGRPTDAATPSNGNAPRMPGLHATDAGGYAADYRDRGLLTTVRDRMRPADANPTGRAMPGLRLGGARPGLTEMVLDGRTRDQAEAAVRPVWPSRREGWNTPRTSGGSRAPESAPVGASRRHEAPTSSGNGGSRGDAPRIERGRGSETVRPPAPRTAPRGDAPRVETPRSEPRETHSAPPPRTEAPHPAPAPRQAPPAESKPRG